MTRVPDVVGRAHRRLAGADSIEQLLAGVAVFLQELPQERIAELPSDCCPRRITTQQDILHWSQRLDGQRMLGARGSRSPGFRVVLDYFAHAAAKAQRLRPRRDLEPPDAMPRRAAPPWPRPSSPPPS